MKSTCENAGEANIYLVSIGRIKRGRKAEQGKRASLCIIRPLPIHYQAAAARLRSDWLERQCAVRRLFAYQLAAYFLLGQYTGDAYFLAIQHSTALEAALK